MLTVENARIRMNKDSGSADLLGWMECVIDDSEHKFYFNNIRVKAKSVEGKFVVRLEFPSKTIVAADGTDKKVYYVKPVSHSAYNLVNSEAVRLLKEMANANKGL